MTAGDGGGRHGDCRLLSSDRTAMPPTSAPKTRGCRALAALAVAALAAAPTFAHNGEIAVAPPLTGIVVEYDSVGLRVQVVEVDQFFEFAQVVDVLEYLARRLVRCLLGLV